MTSRPRTTLETVANPIPGDPEKGGGFWVNNDTVQTVRQRCSRPLEGVALYLALSIVATDYQSRTFHVTYEHLGKLSGINHVKIIPDLLREFDKIDVISIEVVRGCSAIVENLTKITLLGEIRL